MHQTTFYINVMFLDAIKNLTLPPNAFLFQNASSLLNVACPCDPLSGHLSRT